MCHEVTCPFCQKSTWSGCGKHIEIALRGIRNSDRCAGWRTGECPDKGGKRVAEEPPLTSGTPKVPKVGAGSIAGRSTMSCTIEEIEELRGHSARVWDAQWNPTGTLLATCSGDKTIKIWGQNIDGKWECKTTLDGQHARTVRSVAWSPCGTKLAAASFDATATIWDRANGEFECITTLEGHSNEVKSVSWSPSGELLATCSRDKTVWIWEALEDEGEYECLAVLSKHSQDVKCVTWHPTEEVLASAGYDDAIFTYRDDEQDWLCNASLAGHTSTVWSIVFDTTGKRLASCSADGTVKIWKAYFAGNAEGIATEGTDPTWKCTCTLSGYHTDAVYSIDWSRSNGLLATCGEDNSVCVFREILPGDDNQPSFELLASVKNAHPEDVNAVAWCPRPADSREEVLASASDDGTVKLWRLVVPDSS
eukprot:m.886024 g.886024  ORF g.886024 m.886024 type:complete len:422 (-) comp23623_c1_seq8:2438-3703(-)